MAETLELQQVICPSCKQVITSFNPFQAEVECPYCHNKAFNPLITAKKVPIPERIIVFKTTEKKFEQVMVKALVERDYVPTDIFQCINTGKIIKVYLPMYLYEGTFTSSWSCKIAVEATQKDSSGNNETVTKYLPHTGNSQGNFSFLSIAYDGKDIPKELIEFTKHYKYNKLSSVEYDPELLGIGKDDSPLTLALNTDSVLTWNKYGEDYVNELADEKSLEQLSGEKIRDFRTSNSYNLKEKCHYMLAPFWFVYYTYNNEKHFFIMDGIAENADMSFPVNQEEVKYVKNREAIKTLFTWIWPLYAVLWYFIDHQEFNLKVAFFFFALWLFPKLIIDYLMNAQIKTRLADSKHKREEAAKNIEL